MLTTKTMDKGNDDDDEIEVSDEPKDSSAAKCIKFELLGKRFGPEFTHQCFPGEYIPGSRPKGSGDQIEKCSSHASFQHSATHELSIRIQLSPSCETCSVSIDVAEMKKRELQPQTALVSKKQKLTKNNHCDEEDSIELGSDDSDTEDEDDEENDESNVNADESEVRTMSVEEIRQQLAKFLPLLVEGDTDPKYLSRPLGTVLSEYSRQDMDFCLSLCDGKDCLDYHNAIQNLASFFIETADNVNVADQDSTWKVLYLFRKHDKDSKYSLVGYMTLYEFASPFRKPVAGTIVRVCQAVVLPPYQRMGHGKTMLHAVFDWADANKDIVEINVEDPAPGFSMLRNVVDYERFQQSGRLWFGDRPSIGDVAFFGPLKESEALEATASAKTTSKQVQIVYELDRLRWLQAHLEETNNALGCDELEKRFRLVVKQRLNKEHRQEISACEDKHAAKELLARMFDEVYRKYKAILKSVNARV